jgi:hypothetical protein
VIEKTNRKLLTTLKQFPDNRRMNWKLLLSEIRAAGLSQIQIGERLGKSQAWVSAAMGGKYLDLKWGEGQALIALHAQVVPTNISNFPDSQKVA